MANWSEFFSRLGGGLGDYATMLMKENERKKAEALHAKERGEDQAYRASQDTYSHERDRLGDIRTSRKELGDAAEHRSDQLAKIGIMVPDSFDQNARQAELPQASTTNGDVGSMAINALRSAGQTGVDQVYQQGPQALNRAMQGKGLSEPMAGGGFAFIDPSVRASLENAAASRELSRSNRQTLTASQDRAAHDEEAEGLAILNTPNNPALTKAFGPAFAAAREQNPGMTPGRLAKQVFEGLKKVRPDLFPVAQGSGAASALERAWGGEAPAPTVSPQEQQGIVAHRPPTGPPPGTGQGINPDETKAQRWDELVQGGMDPTTATQQVLREFP